MKRIVFSVFLTACCIFCRAQNVIPITSAINLLKQIELAYDSSHNLSFNISYTYTSDTAPASILDSLSGYVQKYNEQYHWMIGNTEVFGNKSLAVMLFKDDKVMYIAKTVPENMNIDMLSRLDSSLLQVSGLRCSVINQKNVTILNLNFPQDNAYKQINLAINKKTGFMESAQFIVKAKFLNEEHLNNTAESDNSYVHIEAKYFNYNTKSSNDSIFDETNFFIKKDKEFITTSHYSDYKIFIGSLNL